MKHKLKHVKKISKRMLAMLLMMLIVFSMDGIGAMAQSVSENEMVEERETEGHNTVLGDITVSEAALQEESSNGQLEVQRNGVSLGHEHSAAITTDGDLYTWGWNVYGQLGDGTTDNKHTPVKIMSDVASVSLGKFHSAAITTDGDLYTWGNNGEGQLGDGTTDKKYTPVKIMSDVASVSLGDYHSAAITTDGDLYTWGLNVYGQLGDGTTDKKYTPVKIMSNVASVSLGGYHSAAITTDGDLYTWGWNSVGQLGDGTTDNKYTPVKIMSDVASVSLGDYHSAAITTDGDLYTWGNNYAGQLGDGETDNKDTPVKIMSNVASVSLRGIYSAAITTDGDLYTWGNNDDGQLGDGTTDKKYTPVKIMSNVASVSLGGYHSAAITTDGNLYTWGSNADGRLGDGTTEDKSTLVKIMDHIYVPSGGSTPLGQYIVGVLQNTDPLTAEVVIDNQTYTVSDDFNMTDAANILVNSESKQVICTTGNGKIIKMEAIEDILEPQLTVAGSGENITYQNGEYIIPSQDIQVRLMCGVKKPYTLADISGVEGVGLNVAYIQTTLPENSLNFGMSGWMNPKPITEKKEAISQKLMPGDVISYDYTVNITDGYEIPLQIKPNLDMNITAEINGTEQEWTEKIVLFNLDYQRQKAEKQREERETASHLSQAQKELEKLCNGNCLTLGTDFNYYLNSTQIKQIKEYLYVWIAEVNNAQTYTNNKNINKKILEKLGINPNVGFFWTQTEASTKVSVQTKYGVKTIEFTLRCGTLNSNGNSYASFGDISYEILEKDGIDKGIPTGGLCGVTTYVGMNDFIECMQNVAEDSIKDAYQEIWGNDANYIAGLIVDDTIMRVIDKKYGSFSNGVYTLITGPAKNYVKKGRVDCPVDVYIYDMDGNLCGSIVDNVVDTQYEDIIMRVEGDSKIFYLTGDDYRIKLEGNDIGTMDYRVEELDQDMGVLRTVTFKDLPLTDGKTYSGYIYEPFYIDDALYSLQTENELIYADNDTYQEEKERVYTTGIILDRENAEMSVGSTLQLQAKVQPENATRSGVLWKSSDATVAVVDDTGKITAKSVGTAQISAITEDGFFEKVCVVKVTDNNKQENDIVDGPDTWKTMSGTEGFVCRLYNIALGRDAEEAGFRNWTQKLNSRQNTAAEVAQGFIFSEEFMNKGYNDTQFVKMLYRTMFGREADEGGLNGWVSDLENGMSREYVFRGFAESQEFTNLCNSYGVERGGVTLSQYRDRNAGATGFIARLYTQMLGRSFDEDGLEYWCRVYLTREKSIEDIASVGFLHSQELANQNLSNEEFVTRMYETFLNREPEEAGLKDWVGRLERGEETRDSLVYGFTHSEEFGNLKAEYHLP